MEILRTNYHQRLTLNKHNNNFYTIDFSNKTIGFTLLTASTINDIQNKWNNLLNIINELVEMDMDYSKTDIKKELERIHGVLEVDFDSLYNIRKEFLEI